MRKLKGGDVDDDCGAKGLRYFGSAASGGVRGGEEELSLGLGDVRGTKNAGFRANFSQRLHIIPSQTTSRKFHLFQILRVFALSSPPSRKRSTHTDTAGSQRAIAKAEGGQQMDLATETTTTTTPSQKKRYVKPAADSHDSEENSSNGRLAICLFLALIFLDDDEEDHDDDDVRLEGYNCASLPAAR